jgi:hypothetical protein
LRDVVVVPYDLELSRGYGKLKASLAPGTVVAAGIPFRGSHITANTSIGFRDGRSSAPRSIPMEWRAIVRGVHDIPRGSDSDFVLAAFVKKESTRVCAKECGTGCDGVERGRGVPSKTRKPAMAPSEASV